MTMNAAATKETYHAPFSKPARNDATDPCPMAFIIPTSGYRYTI
jgi:hypothetical protein